MTKKNEINNLNIKIVQTAATVKAHVDPILKVLAANVDEDTKRAAIAAITEIHKKSNSLTIDGDFTMSGNCTIN